MVKYCTTWPVGRKRKEVLTYQLSWLFLVINGSPHPSHLLSTHHPKFYHLVQANTLCGVHAPFLALAMPFLPFSSQGFWAKSQALPTCQGGRRWKKVVFPTGPLYHFSDSGPNHPLLPVFPLGAIGQQPPRRQLAPRTDVPGIPTPWEVRNY